MIDEWDEIEFLLVYKKEINFIKSYRQIKSNTHLLEHIHTGHPRIKLRKRNGVQISSEGVITGSHNLQGLRPPPPPPLQLGEMSWLIPPLVENSDPLNPSFGYQQGSIQRNMSDLIDPKTKSAFVKGDGSSIVTENNNVYIPESYSNKRINEEMAYANSKTDISKPIDVKINSIGEYSFFYREYASDGDMLELVHFGTNSNPKLANLQTVYPLGF